jgi:alpha-glucosidase
MTAANNNWWRGGVIYQIYPRSYADSNGDGIGDLPGITGKLGYIAELGVDAIWLSPFFKSPMKDFGYDVSDYCDVDPMFGTLADFRELVNTAHSKGLKVMIDQVLSHTSDQHPWFAESRSNKTNAKADWYVWADSQPDGTPPNNWLSIFGGSGWQWDTRRCQYYLHNFLASQPDLNFHNLEVQDALLETVKFWLDLGVDGYRLDTANFYFHDKDLRNNPPALSANSNPAVANSNPYNYQQHIWDKSRPENLAFLQRLRSLLNQYPNTTMVGEIGCDDSLGRMAEYTSGGDKLHMAYSFDLLGSKYDAPYIHDVMSRFNARVGNGWPSWALANHDSMRIASRWQGDPRFLRLAAAMQLSLRGSPCLYQGDELGLPEAVIAFEDLQDPFGITMWPEFKGRDGCRTPMPWLAGQADLGFGNGSDRAWLPITASFASLTADQQAADKTSLLHFYRHILQWRKGQAALISGEMQMLPVDPAVLAFERSHGGETVACLFNISDKAVSYPCGAGTLVAGCGIEGATLNGNTVSLPAFGVAFVKR